MNARVLTPLFVVLALLVGSTGDAAVAGPRRQVTAPGSTLERPVDGASRPSLDPPVQVQRWRGVALGTAYAGLYGGAAKVGSRLGLEDHFVVRRLETAWIIDVFGHVYATRQTAHLFSLLHGWAGHDPHTARVHGAWSAAFGALTYMEVINGFMPNVRFDWVDPISNAFGAWTWAEGPDVADRHPWMARLSLELGYDDWGRLGEPDDEAGAFTRIWHDYPNQRWGVGYGLGPLDGEWLRVFGTYGVTALDIDLMRQEWGVGVELKPHHWFGRWIRKVPGGGPLLDFVDLLDRNLLLPGLYVHLATWETAPFSDREPFQE